MSVYWVDSSVLIQSRHKYHTKERIPQFWIWLDKQCREGVVRMPHKVYKEVTDGTDWLVQWCKLRQSFGLDVPHDDDIEQAFKELQRYVGTRYKHVPHKIIDWARGADGWLVAAAKARGGVVVSEEDKAKRNDTNVIKIPDLARDFADRKWMDTFAMMDALGADFSGGAGGGV